MGFLDIFKDKDENENRDDFMRKFAGMEENSNFDSEREPEPAQEPSSFSQPAEEPSSYSPNISSSSLCSYFRYPSFSLVLHATAWGINLVV